MKCFSAVALVALLTLSPVDAGPNPVSRVADLLKNLASKVDSELDAETDMYESYVCWAKTVVNTKTASNEVAQSRVDSLKTYLADLDAGRIELTSERSDLEKEVAGLNSDLETAKSLRDKENEDYKSATKEMTQAITGLDSAIKVLDEATKKSKGSLLSVRASISQSVLAGEGEGFSQRVVEADQLQNAVDVSSRWLKQGDALFLKRLLSGEVPKADWKKLNRKADFKMKYKARSVKIQNMLVKLRQTFKDNKDDADEKEKDNKATYDKLKKAKDAQLKAATGAQNKEAVEKGAAAVSSNDAKAEIKSLSEQVTNDKKYIAETTKALEDKKKEFVTRKGLRVGEIAAINEAIGVIHSDDARDLFKRQTVSFLQVDQSNAVAVGLATSALRSAALAAGDLRLNAMADRVAMNAGAKFDKVLSAIDKMIKALEGEDKKDGENAAECKKERAADTKESASLSANIDDLTDDISKLNGEIKQNKKEVAEKEKSIEDLEKEMKDAKRLRADENSEWKKNDADDSAAIKLLEQCAGVLKSFYKKNFKFVQIAAKAQAPGDKGEAPPPPPKTWDDGYGGAQKEQNGIVGILGLIQTDMEKDQVEGKAAEDTAQKNYDKFVSESQDSKKKLETGINDLNESTAKKEKSIKSKKTTMGTKKGALGVVIKKMKDAAPGCDFLLVNFKVRAANRKLELSGLAKAKDILKAKNK